MQRRACSVADPVRVYVYNSSAAQFKDTRHGMDLFESKIQALVEAVASGTLPAPLSFTVTRDPSKAEVF